MGYSFSRYVYKAEDGEGVILYSLRNGALVMLEKDEYESVCACLSDGEQKSEVFAHLLMRGFLVEKGSDEASEVLIEHYRAVEQSETLHLTIYLTEECNFCCEYCFVRKHGRAMTDDVFEGVYRMIEERIDDYKSVHISWFGGEPLMRIETLTCYNLKIAELCAKKRKGFKNTLVTNGFLLTLENFGRLYDSFIRDIQVTFDGTKENHNRYRYDSNGGSFDTIFTNLRKIQKSAYSDCIIKVRCNFADDRDTETVSEFISQYNKYFLRDGRFGLAIKPVVNYDELDKSKLAVSYQGKADIICRILKDHPEHRDMLLELIRPRKYWCNVLCSSSYVISAVGEIYMCDSVINMPSFRSGRIVADRKAVMDESAVTLPDAISENCRKCRRLPICFGSCTRILMTAERHACSITDRDIKQLLRNYILLENEVIKP